MSRKSRRKQRTSESKGSPVGSRFKLVRRPALILGLIGLAALAIRLAHVQALGASPISNLLLGDAREYVAWARDIAAGHWLGTEIFFQAPLYPYLLAVLFLVLEPSVEYVRLLQAAFGAVSCVLLALAGRRFFGWPAGLAAGGLLAIYPAGIFFDGLAQKASLDLLLISALLLTIGEFTSRPRRRWLIAMGLVFGCLLINRENARVLYPLLAGWLLADARAGAGRARLAAALIFTVCAALPVVPVALRNYAVGGEAVLSTSQLGATFYIGNRSGATGFYEPLVPGRGSARYERDDSTKLAAEAFGRPVSAGEASSYWLNKSLAEIRTNPAGWLALMARKSLLSINAAEAMDTESVTFHRTYSPVLRLLGWFTYGLLLPLAVAGVWVTRRDWRNLVMLYGMFVLLHLSVIAFFVLERYRFPTIPVAILFAAVALTRWRDWTRMPINELVLGACLTGAAALTANWPVAMPPDASSGNAGTELLRAGQPEAAIPFLEQDVERSPALPPALYDLAQAYAKAGQFDRASLVFGRLVQLRPQNAEYHRARAVTLLQAGRPDEALAPARQAATLQPGSATMLEVVGNALLQNGDLAQAAAAFRRALELDPNHATAHNNLANLLVSTGQTAAAVSHYRRALEIAPGNAQARSNLALALEQTGDAEGALEHLREAVRLRPWHAQLRLNLGDLLVRLGRSAEAHQEFEQALDLSRQDPATLLAAQLRLAEVLARGGRPDEARARLLEALATARAAGMSAESAEIEATIRMMGR